jgi:hypothetical protein
VIFLETPALELRDLLTPVGLLALVVAAVQAWLRYREDRPKIKSLEERVDSLDKENIGLSALVKQRYDFGAAVDAMKAQTMIISSFLSEITDAIKTGHDLRGQLSSRIEQNELKQAQEHRAIVEALSENTKVLNEIHLTIQEQRWDGRQDRRRG